MEKITDGGIYRMTMRERVVRALEHKESDMVPYDVSFTWQARGNMAKYSGDSDYCSNRGQHIALYQYWGWPVEIPGSTEQFRDEFGVIWDRSGADKDIGVIANPLIPDLDSHSYVFPPIDERRLRGDLQELAAAKGGRFVFAGIGFSMFERAWSLCGMENVLMNMLTGPEELEELLDAITERNLQVLDIMLEYTIDGVYFGDDWGQQKGMIMGAPHWRRFIKPRMKRMYERAKQAGRFVAQHSCGDIAEVFHDLIEIGLDCYQTFQPEIYDIEKIKREYGADLAFWGGISTQQLLSRAAPEEVRHETARIMKIMKTQGGYIAAPTHAISHDIPPENVEAMLEVFRNQSRYI